MKLVWFRRDLRTGDHPGLEAAGQAPEAAALLVDDEAIRAAAAPARVTFYDGAVAQLLQDLGRDGTRALREPGPPEAAVPRAAVALGATEVIWTIERGPGARRDRLVERALGRERIPVRIVSGDLAVEPDWVERGGTFAAYFRRWKEAARRLPPVGTHPRLPSPLSPHLRFGLVSARRLVGGLGPEETWDDETASLARNLAWRDYAYWLAARNPGLLREGLEPWSQFLEWREDPKALAAWQQGRTGYPIVDASMRQLAAEGFIDNARRMLVGSFLTKHLGIDWREGARWFMRTLVDGDPIVNAMNWQWVASVGVERAGYIRILNPELQAKRLDPDGSYRRRWIPELEDRYDAPIVEHRPAREEALARYRRAKERWRASLA